MAIRLAKRTATNAVSWSELRRALKLWKYRKRYFLHNNKAQRSIKLLHSNVFYVQGHSRLTAERHWSAMLFRRSDSLRLETFTGLRSKSRKVPCESHRTLVRCGLPPLLSHFPLQLKLGKIRRSPTVGEAGGMNAVSAAFFPREPWAIRMEKQTATNAVSWSEL